MNCHIFVVWPDDHGHGHGHGHGLMILGMIQCRKTFQRFVELVAAKVRWMMGEVKLIIHDCLTMMVKGWADRVPGDQWVGLQGPRRSTGRFDGPSLEGRYVPIYICDPDD